MRAPFISCLGFTNSSRSTTISKCVALEDYCLASQTTQLPASSPVLRLARHGCFSLHCFSRTELDLQRTIQRVYGRLYSVRLVSNCQCWSHTIDGIPKQSIRIPSSYSQPSPPPVPSLDRPCNSCSCNSPCIVQYPALHRDKTGHHQLWKSSDPGRLDGLDLSSLAPCNLGEKSEC